MPRLLCIPGFRVHVVFASIKHEKRIEIGYCFSTLKIKQIFIGLTEIVLHKTVCRTSAGEKKRHSEKAKIIIKKQVIILSISRGQKERVAKNPQRHRIAKVSTIQESDKNLA